MFYGAPVTSPMEVPREMPSRFRPELEMTELPVMKDATSGTIRLEGTLSKRMPSMPVSPMHHPQFPYGVPPRAPFYRPVSSGCFVALSCFLVQVLSF